MVTCPVDGNDSPSGTKSCPVCGNALPTPAPLSPKTKETK